MTRKTSRKKELALVWSIHSLREGENTFHLTFDQEDIGMQNGKVQNPIECSIVLNRNDSVVTFSGTINFSLDLECARCFKHFNLKKTETAKAYYLSKESFLNGAKDNLSSKDVMTEYYEHECIDIGPVLYDTINLTIPIKSLCDKSCKGLCSECGENLNKKQCRCRKEKTDPRWEPLNKLIR
ncbi:MAG: DUF177 domain-containing protein [Candidatus Cloacimonadota bacterium]|nr:MAG: DUF177 domain-containing protein [Candidatus Cloacimonadota bacterium]